MLGSPQVSVLYQNLTGASFIPILSTANTSQPGAYKPTAQTPSAEQKQESVMLTVRGLDINKVCSESKKGRGFNRIHLFQLTNTISAYTIK